MDLIERLIRRGNNQGRKEAETVEAGIGLLAHPAKTGPSESLSSGKALDGRKCDAAFGLPTMRSSLIDRARAQSINARVCWRRVPRAVPQRWDLAAPAPTRSDLAGSLQVACLPSFPVHCMHIRNIHVKAVSPLAPAYFALPPAEASRLLSRPRIRCA